MTPELASKESGSIRKSCAPQRRVGIEGTVPCLASTSPSAALVHGGGTISCGGQQVIKQFVELVVNGGVAQQAEAGRLNRPQ